MNITVFIPSGFASNPLLERRAAELGEWIARNNHRLIYGGGKTGFAKILADAVLDNGGEVTGVVTNLEDISNQSYKLVSKRIVVASTSAKIGVLDNLGGIFIVFPGGIETFEAAMTTIRKISRGVKKAPFIIYNVGGYYDGLKTLFEQAELKGLSYIGPKMGVCYMQTLSGIEEAVKFMKTRRAS